MRNSLRGRRGQGAIASIVVAAVAGFLLLAGGGQVLGMQLPMAISVWPFTHAGIERQSSMLSLLQSAEQRETTLSDGINDMIRASQAVRLNTSGEKLQRERQSIELPSRDIGAWLRDRGVSDAVPLSVSAGLSKDLEGEPEGELEGEPEGEDPWENPGEYTGQVEVPLVLTSDQMQPATGSSAIAAGALVFDLYEFWYEFTVELEHNVKDAESLLVRDVENDITLFSIPVTGSTILYEFTHLQTFAALLVMVDSEAALGFVLTSTAHEDGELLGEPRFPFTLPTLIRP